MSVVRCSKGHFYDDQRFSQCPHCGIFSEAAGAGAGGSEAAGGRAGEGSAGEKKRGLFGWLDREKTVAFGADRAVMPDEGKTVSYADAAKSPGKAGSGSSGALGDTSTVSLSAVDEGGDDDQRTIGVYSGAKGNDYVTGWLVCTEGAEKGRDYRLHHGFNRIGRSYDMDVQVLDDPAISRENHCSVVFDDKSCRFSVLPSTGALTYYQGTLLTEPKPLHTGDEIRLGDSCFVFIPFCGEGRVWEKEEE